MEILLFASFFLFALIFFVVGKDDFGRKQPAVKKEPKVEAKEETKVEAKEESKVETKEESKVETKEESKETKE